MKKIKSKISPLGLKSIRPIMGIFIMLFSMPGSSIENQLQVPVNTPSTLEANDQTLRVLFNQMASKLKKTKEAERKKIIEELNQRPPKLGQNQESFHFLIVDNQGRFIVYPTQIRLLGRNFQSILDHETHENIWEMVKKKLEEGGGYVHFFWPHPQERVLNAQRMYVKKIDSHLWMGVGVFLR